MLISTSFSLFSNKTSLLALFLCFIFHSSALFGQSNELITTCNTTFYDDGGEDYPYLEDGTGGQVVHTYTICPEMPSMQVILVSFNQFEVAPGDQLLAYDGLVIDPAYQFGAPVGGSGTGASVSDAPGGGWVQASCENESGCVTLLFERNNDNIKGQGFEVDVRCMTRDIVMNCPSSPLLEQIACGYGETTMQIRVPTLSICGAASLWNITTACPIDGLPSTLAGDVGTITADFPIGTHIIRFESAMYPDKFCEIVVYVEAPALACENEVYFALTNDCTVSISPEIILEDLCENEFFEYELAISNLYDLGTFSITADGYYVIELAEIDCEKLIRVQVRRTYKGACGTQDVVDNCFVDVYVQDIVAPYLTGDLLDEYDIICVQDNVAVLDSLNTLASGANATSLTLGAGIPLHLRDLSQVFGNSISDNCDNWTYHVSDWQELYVDCTENSFEGYDYDGNGIADDVLWDIMAIEFGRSATLRKYFRTIEVADECGNTSNIAVQCVNVKQPDIVAPLLDIEVPCGTDIAPEALFNAWADGSHPEFATYIPNYDPTPLTVNLGDLDFGGLEDMTFTDDSGDEIPAVMTHAACGYAISWEDAPAVQACGNGYKVFRDWTIFNWCDGHLEFIDVIPQVIKVSDTQAPILTEKIDYILTSSTIVDECYAGITFFYPELEDDCSSEVYVAVEMNGEEQQFLSDELYFNQIVIGENVICSIRTWDECGNTNTFLDTIQVEDNIPPIAVCENVHIIALGQDCSAVVEAYVFDDGSYDNCSALQYKVARLDDDDNGDGFPEIEDFDTYVTFTNADLTTCEENSVLVALLIEDAAGNQNSCIVEVKVQDIIAPISEAIQVHLTCKEDAVSELVDIRDNIEDERLQYWALNEMLLEDRLGHLDVLDNNCGEHTLEIVNVNFEEFEGNCKTGIVFFEYILRDFCGNISNTAEGRIDISLDHNWIMQFPPDRELFCTSTESIGQLQAASISDILNNQGCDTWALNVEEEYFVSEEDACYELVRSYHLLNWCTWNPSNTEVAVVERPSQFLDEDQVVYLSYQDSDLDSINDLNDEDENEGDTYDTTPLANDADFVLLDATDLSYQNILNYQATSNFTNTVANYVSAQAYGNIVYRQRIRVYDTGAPTLELMSNTTNFCSAEDGSVEDCLAKVDLTFQVNDVCSTNELMQVNYQLQAFNGASTQDFFGELTYLGDGQYQIIGDYPLQNGEMATQHTFSIEVTDNCGNRVTQDIPIQVNDCTPPTAYCIFGLSADLDANGEVELWATDFDAGSYDNCSPKAQLVFSFEDPRVATAMPNRTFRCEDGEIGTVPIRLWVQDLAGNVSACETFVVIQANSGDEGCTTGGADAMLSGVIMTESNEAVEGVDVNLSGAFDNDKVTSNSGYYAFTAIDFEHDYTIAPSKNDNPLNGISTFDLVLMSKHILGIESLDSPYKILAADVNNSRSITTFDMVQLRRLILNLDHQFTNNTSWRFIPAGHEFIDPQNPWLGFIPEVMNFNNLNEPYLNADFIGIKIGDLNNTVQANDLQQLEGRTASGTLHIELPNIYLASGNRYEIPLHAPDLAQLTGYQYTLAYDTKALEIIDIEGKNIENQNFAVIEKGLITFSWNGEIADTPTLCELYFRAKADVALHEVLRIVDHPTPIEAYTQYGELWDIRLGFQTATAQAILYQNEPNPFDDETTISFYLPEATTAILEILDVSGKLLYHSKGEYTLGQHAMRINLSNWKASGLLYYRLRTNGFTQARKMVRL